MCPLGLTALQGPAQSSGLGDLSGTLRWMWCIRFPTSPIAGLAVFLEHTTGRARAPPPTQDRWVLPSSDPSLIVDVPFTLPPLTIHSAGRRFLARLAGAYFPLTLWLRIIFLPCVVHCRVYRCQRRHTATDVVRH